MSDTGPSPQPTPPDFASMTDSERAGAVLGFLKRAGEGVPLHEALRHQAFAAGSMIYDGCGGDAWEALLLVALFSADVVNTIRTLERMGRAAAAEDGAAPVPAEGSAGA